MGKENISQLSCPSSPESNEWEGLLLGIQEFYNSQAKENIEGLEDRFGCSLSPNFRCTIPLLEQYYNLSTLRYAATYTPSESVHKIIATGELFEFPRSDTYAVNFLANDEKVAYELVSHLVTYALEKGIKNLYFTCLPGHTLTPKIAEKLSLEWGGVVIPKQDPNNYLDEHLVQFFDFSTLQSQTT